MSKIEQLIKEKCPNGVEYKKLSSVIEVKRGSRLTRSQLLENGIYEVYHGSKDIPLGRYNKFNTVGDTVIIVNTGGIGGVKYLKDNFWCSDGCFNLGHNDKINNKFLYYYLSQYEAYFVSQKRIGGVPTIDKNVVKNIKIPIPPIEVQEEIVKILDKFSELEEELKEELETRKKQYEFWRNKILNKKYNIKYLHELAINLDNKRKPVTKSDRESGEFPYYGASGIVDYVSNYIFDDELLLVSEDGANLKARSTPIAFSSSGKVWINNHAHVLKFNSRITQKYVEHYLNMIDLTEYITGAAQPKLNQDNLNKIRINIPLSLEEQERIVNILDKFNKLVNDISEGIPAEIEARKKQYEYYRNKLLSFEELKVND